MVDFWNLKVSEYRQALINDAELRKTVIEILKYGYRLKEEKSDSRDINYNGKRACYGMILLLNGKTAFDEVSRELVNNAVSHNLLDKTFITTGNYAQVAVKYWNVKNGAEYVSTFYGDVVKNLTGGEQAKKSGKGLSEKMQTYMRATIADLTIEAVTKQVKELFAKSELIDDNEREKRIQELNCFVNAVNSVADSSKQIIDEVETDEVITKEIKYEKSISEINLSEVPPPKTIPTEEKEVVMGTIKSLNEQEAAMKEKNRKKKGIYGEALAIQIEKDRLTKLGRPDLIEKIDHVAKRKDGLGYDIKSVDIDGDGNEIDIYIEVKTTSGGIDRAFYVSAREVYASKMYGEDYYIYRIFGVNEDADDIQYYKLKGSIRDTCNLKEVSYIAIAKN